MSSSFTWQPVTFVSLTGYSFRMWFPTSTKLLFQGGFNVNIFSVNPFLSEGWFVRRLGEWFALVECGGSTCKEGNFYWICRLLICNFTEHVRFLQVFFMYFAEADYLAGFCVDQCPGRKGLIVTWIQILNCDITRESMFMRESIHMCVCAYLCAHGHRCLRACGCSHVHLCACIKIIFNCILTIACTCA